MAACGHSVVSFEPFKENIALLQMSMCLNKIEDRVELFQHGLGTQDATCNLASFDINHGSHAAAPRAPAHPFFCDPVLLRLTMTTRYAFT